MKHIFTAAILILLSYLSFSQVLNDDCSNAINFGTLTLTHNSPFCVDGTINTDTSAIGTTINATPSNPYHCMTGCLGYTPNNDMQADDVWYRFKAEAFSIRVFPYYITSDPLDTVHLNVWYGPDCNSLSPAGCYTFSNYPCCFETTFTGADTSISWVYLQLSGNGIGVQGDFAFCLITDPVSPTPYYGTSVICSTTDINEYNPSNFQLYPNPFTNSTIIEFKNSKKEKHILTLYNRTGQLVRQIENITTGKIIIDRKNLTNGLYFFQLLNEREIVGYGKLIIE